MVLIQLCEATRLLAQLALKGHHVFPGRIMLYARQLGLTTNQARNVANASGPEKCKER
jgi:hypothetical protein